MCCDLQTEGSQQSKDTGVCCVFPELVDLIMKTTLVLLLLACMLLATNSAYVAGR